MSSTALPTLDELAQRVLEELLCERLTPAEYQIATEIGEYWVARREEDPTPALHDADCDHPGGAEVWEANLAEMFRRNGGMDLYPADCVPHAKHLYDQWCAYSTGFVSCDELLTHLDVLWSARFELLTGLPAHSQSVLQRLMDDPRRYPESYRRFRTEVEEMLTERLRGLDADTLALLAILPWGSERARMVYEYACEQRVVLEPSPMVVAFFSTHSLAAPLLRLWSPAVVLGKEVGIISLSRREYDALAAALHQDRGFTLRGAHPLTPEVEELLREPLALQLILGGLMDVNPYEAISPEDPEDVLLLQEAICVARAALAP